METRRFILYALMAFLLYSLWTAWQFEHVNPLQPETSVSHAASQNSTASVNALLPDLGENTPAESSSSASLAETKADDTSAETTSTTELIHVKTDVFSLDIDPQFGDIVRVALLNYPVSVDDKDTPTVLLTEQNAHRYTANSSLLERGAQGVQNSNFNFQSDSKNYQFTDNQNRLNVVLMGHSAEGLQVKKTFVFTRGNYLIEVRYDLDNGSGSAWEGFLNTQIFRTAPDEDKSSLFHIGSFTGASYSNPGTQRYKKVGFSDMSKANLNVAVKNGWIAMQQHYFLSAWIPDTETANTLYSRAAGDTYTIGLVSQPIVVNAADSKAIRANLYIGPEITSNLKAISPGLDLTIDYGWLWFLSSFLFTLMTTIYNFVGNWGWSIVLVTVLVKLVFYRLSASSYRSMAGMRKLQPKLQALRERCGDDKAKLSQATMELYRQEKINPLGGCLPIVVQIPVFIALYWVLLESVELRQAPFIFWIHDLAAADAFHVLPIIMGITMLIQQRLNPAPPDPMQAKIMMFLPIMFTGLFWNFPAGLVLYWIVNNSLSILQQWIITRKYS